MTVFLLKLLVILARSWEGYIKRFGPDWKPKFEFS